MSSFLSLILIVLAAAECHATNASLRGLTDRGDEMKTTEYNSPSTDSNTSDEEIIRPYNYVDIEKSTSLFVGYYSRILIFDGKDFSLYNIRDKHTTLHTPNGGRALKAIPLLVHALKTNFPERFKEGEPPFQMMYTDGDALHFVGRCTNHPEECDMPSMPPLLAHGTVPKDVESFPFIKEFPNAAFLDCLYDFNIKELPGPCVNPFLPYVSPRSDIGWEDLIPTIIWRGSDNHFAGFIEEYESHNRHRGDFSMLKNVNAETTRSEILEELLSHYDTMTPRWMAVMKTVLTDTQNSKWIDVRFSGNGNKEYHDVFNEHGVLVHGKVMDKNEMSCYRYQIDFGGGGGTTWSGTIMKLAMPGVLFHHETAMKDWYFDLMQPWVHYIPVKWDLSDLYDRYQWAESNQERCQEISRAATELATYLMSSEYVEKLNSELYRDYLGSVIAAYQPTEIEKKYSGYTIQAHFMNIYDQDGYELTPVSTCDDRQCTTPWEDGVNFELYHVSVSQR